MNFKKASWTATIVIIEDDPATEQSLMDCLSDLGAIVPFSSAEDALAYAERGGSIDLVITDIVLGRMNGIEFGRKLSEILGKDRIIPIVFYTSFGDLEMERLAYEAGAADFIEKPVSFSRLQLRIKNLLEMSRRSAVLLDRANRDSVTGLLQRKDFIREAGQELGKRLFTQQHSALLMINIRGFASLNQTLGLDRGDALLSSIGKRLGDIGEDRGYLMGRYLSDRFLILIPEGDEALIEAEAERLINSVEFEAEQNVKDLSSKLEIQLRGSIFEQPEDLRTGVAGTSSVIEQMISQCQMAFEHEERLQLLHLELAH